MKAPAGTDVILDVEGVNHWFGSHHVLHDVHLDIARGQIVSVVGPSGCGKSTLLRGVVGTHPPKGGVIKVRGAPVSGPGRDRGIVYQQYSLFPFLTALENVAFGLMVDETTFFDRWATPFKWRALRRTHHEKAAAQLEAVNLGHALHRYPHQLSGGMRQRVAIAQALVMEPEILLLDEPFGALDEATREDLQDLLLSLYQENETKKAAGEKAPYTIMIVTHELNEALYVANRVVGLSQYWRYQDDGHTSCPGATVVYDRAAPIFRPDQSRDYEVLVEQRHEIRQVVFEPKEPKARGEYVRYWAEQQGSDDGEQQPDAKPEPEPESGSQPDGD